MEGGAYSVHDIGKRHCNVLASVVRITPRVPLRFHLFYVSVKTARHTCAFNMGPFLFVDERTSQDSVFWKTPKIISSIVAISAPFEQDLVFDVQSRGGANRTRSPGTKT